MDPHAAGHTPHLLQGFNSLFQKAVLSTKPLQARSKLASGPKVRALAFNIQHGG